MSRRHSSSRKRKSSRRKGKPRIPSYSSLTEREKETYRRVLNFFSDLRGGKGSYSALLSKHHLDGRTVRKYLGRNLLGGTHGKPVRASKADRLVRELIFPMPSGDVPVRIRSSRDATKLSEFFHDRYKLLRGKLRANDFEAKWRGVHVAGQELFADAAAILGMADADVLKVETLYASTGGAR